MTGAKRVCSTCGNKFIGTARARYCSPACKQRAHRGRKGDYRNARSVTVTPPSTPAAGTRSGRRPTDEGHCAEAIALLAALDSELAENSAVLGYTADTPLEWSAAERTLLDQLVDALDRKADLAQAYRESEDYKLRIKLSGEIRLLEASVDRMLKRVRTDLPERPSSTSQKASRAAKSRWARDAAR